MCIQYVPGQVPEFRLLEYLFLKREIKFLIRRKLEIERELRKVGDFETPNYVCKTKSSKEIQICKRAEQPEALSGEKGW
mgnify:CR=1 FL=1